MHDEQPKAKQRRPRKRARANGEGAVYRRASDGRWCAAVTVYEGVRRRRRYFYAPTMAAVIAERDKALETIRNGGALPDKRQTLGAFLAHWLENVVALRVRPRTLRSYRDLCALHITPQLGHLPLAALEPAHVQRWCAKLASKPAGATRGRGAGKGRPLSPRTQRYVLALLKMVLAQAEQDQLVPRNVARGVTVRADDDDSAPGRKHWTVAETRGFLAALQGERYGALFLVTAARGLRIGEALALRWANLRLDGDPPTLRVEGTLQREGRGDARRWYIGPPKSKAGRRALALSPSLVAALRRHRGAQLEERLRAGAAWQDHDFVFSAPNGAPLDERNVRRAFDRIVAAAELPRINLHGLRHSHASALVLDGTNIKQVSASLGHSRVSTTLDIYAHVVSALDEKASDRLEELLFAPQPDGAKQQA